jgi:hypothetical protein
MLAQHLHFRRRFSQTFFQRLVALLHHAGFLQHRTDQRAHRRRGRVVIELVGKMLQLVAIGAGILLGCADIGAQFIHGFLQFLGGFARRAQHAGRIKELLVKLQRDFGRKRPIAGKQRVDGVTQSRVAARVIFVPDGKIDWRWRNGEARHAGHRRMGEFRSLVQIVVIHPRIPQDGVPPCRARPADLHFAAKPRGWQWSSEKIRCRDSGAGFRARPAGRWNRLPRQPGLFQ